MSPRSALRARPLTVACVGGCGRAPMGSAWCWPGSTSAPLARPCLGSPQLQLQPPAPVRMAWKLLDVQAWPSPERQSPGLEGPESRPRTSNLGTQGPTEGELLPRSREEGICRFSVRASAPHAPSSLLFRPSTSRPPGGFSLGALWAPKQGPTDSWPWLPWPWLLVAVAPVAVAPAPLPQGA